MANKKLLTTLGIAGAVLIGGGGIYGYNFYNDPLTKIANAENELTEGVGEFFEHRLEEDLKWHKDNKDKDKTLDIAVLPLFSKAKMYYDPKDNKGLINLETAMPGEKIDLTIRDKDEKNLTLESEVVEFAVGIPKQLIKDKLKAEGADYEKVTGIDINSLDISINEFVKLFFSWDNTDQKLSKTEKLEILTSIPKETAKKENDKYILTLNKENINTLLSKYEEIMKPKLKSDFEKKYFASNIKNLKEEISKNLDNDIKIEYTLNDNEVTRVISTKNDNKDVKLEVKTKTTKDAVELSVKDLGENQGNINITSKKVGDKKYEDTFEVNGSHPSDKVRFTANTKHENDKTITTFVANNGDTSVFTTEIKDNKLQYVLSASNEDVLTITYNSDVEKPAETSKEIKDLSGKSDEEQDSILSEFMAKLLKLSVNDTSEEE